MTSFSIVVPFYEKHDAWWNTLEDLRIQLSPGDQVIIVDDHSPSGPPECDCPLVKIVHPNKLENHIYRCNTLRNLGIETAENDAIIMLDPDCIPSPHFMRNARKNFDSGVLFGGRIDFKQEDGTVQDDPRLSRRRKTALKVWGGCMMFSKERTRRLGWFSSEYDGGWGLGETDFVYKCFHSGMVIAYLEKLCVLHQYHERNTAGHADNMKLVSSRRKLYAMKLDEVTDYKPRVGVCILTMMPTQYLKRCLRSIAKTKIPVKVFLVSQGNVDEERRRVIDQWGDRWAVHPLFNDPPKRPESIKDEVSKMARSMGIQHVVTVNDYSLLQPDSIEKLVADGRWVFG